MSASGAYLFRCAQPAGREEALVRAPQRVCRCGLTLSGPTRQILERDDVENPDASGGKLTLETGAGESPTPHDCSGLGLHRGDDSTGTAGPRKTTD